jgi:hypothetical protein
LSWYGGLIGGVGAGLAYILIKGWPVVPILAAATPALTFGHLIGRIGCFLVGDDCGTPSALPWAVAFPEGLHRQRCLCIRCSCTRHRPWRAWIPPAPVAAQWSTRHDRPWPLPRRRRHPTICHRVYSGERARGLRTQRRAPRVAGGDCCGYRIGMLVVSHPARQAIYSDRNVS